MNMEHLLQAPSESAEYNPVKPTNFSNPVYDNFNMDGGNDEIDKAIEFIPSSPDHTQPGTLTTGQFSLDRNSNEPGPFNQEEIPAKPMVKSARGSYQPTYDSGRDTQMLVEIEEEDEY